MTSEKIGLGNSRILGGSLAASNTQNSSREFLREAGIPSEFTSLSRLMHSRRTQVGPPMRRWTMRKGFQWL